MSVSGRGPGNSSVGIRYGIVTGWRREASFTIPHACCLSRLKTDGAAR